MIAPWQRIVKTCCPKKVLQNVTGIAKNSLKTFKVNQTKVKTTKNFQVEYACRRLNVSQQTHHTISTILDTGNLDEFIQ